MRVASLVVIISFCLHMFETVSKELLSQGNGVDIETAISKPDSSRRNADDICLLSRHPKGKSTYQPLATRFVTNTRDKTFSRAYVYPWVSMSNGGVSRLVSLCKT